MDDIVKQAMSKWPNVPDCYGWLGLDARGNWYMRDDRAQALGAFDSGVCGSKGSELRHAKLIDFIGRNYAPDARGCWHFQNGPQRVYVELQAVPLVWRIEPDGCVHDHIGRPAADVSHAYLDEQGWLYLDSSRGLGLVHTQDMHLAADLIEHGRWMPQDILHAELAARFGFVKSPLGLNALQKM
ncbi:MAG: DUF2946 family protein [Rhodoferax sp.]|nr:DUF2946 family protein [Rhodoferax sp.]